MKKATAVLVVDRIEPNLDLWERHLGWARTVEIPAGDALGFVMLQKDGVELMYQSRASLADDLPAVASALAAPAAFVFIEVASLDAVAARLPTGTGLVPERSTFYGSREICVRDASGNALTFAEFGAPAAAD